jgi:peptidoglycan/xylan/chitin deacetylase (PgdA/CDA1 family)
MIGHLPDALMYHYIRDVGARPVVGYRALDPAVFEAQLDDVCRTRTPVAWPDLLAALQGLRALPRDGVLLTFDDGLADHHRVVLPRLAARGLRGLFFVMARRPGDGLTVGHQIHVLGGVLSASDLRAEILDRLSLSARSRHGELEAGLRAAGLSDADDPWKRPLQRELEREARPVLAAMIRQRCGSESELAAELHLDDRQLHDLRAAGMTLGGHGRDHTWLDWDAATAEREIEASARFLDQLEPAPWAFAYPYGAPPPNARGRLAAAGFAAAFTTRAGQRPSRFEIGRHDADELPPGGLAALWP